MVKVKHCQKRYRQHEEMGRIALSEHFLFREFLYSEIAVTHGLTNTPTNLNLAIEVGRQLCTELLEPIQQRFGRISIRSGYRSAEVNELGHRLGLNCASNRKNAAAHIWDVRDQNGKMGATACVVVPSFYSEHRNEGDWRILADWIDRSLNYSTLCFFPKLWAFNIQWHEVPKRDIKSYAAPKGRYSRQLPLPI
jgi:hypothetical protein